MGKQNGERWRVATANNTTSFMQDRREENENEEEKWRKRQTSRGRLLSCLQKMVGGNQVEESDVSGDHFSVLATASLLPSSDHRHRRIVSTRVRFVLVVAHCARLLLRPRGPGSSPANGPLKRHL